MNEGMQKTLHALKDVQGIQGSFVMNDEGRLLAMEMPSLYDESLFGDVGSRLERLSETFSSLGEEMDTCMVRFQDHILSLKQFPTGGSLCILSDATVNLPALRMATNLAQRRLAAEVPKAEPLSAAAAAVPAPAPAPPPVAAAAPQPEPVAVATAPKPVRYYRGHPVDD